MTPNPIGRPRNTEPQTRISWQLDAEVLAALREEAARTGVPMKTLVERAVRAYLAPPHIAP